MKMTLEQTHEVIAELYASLSTMMDVFPVRDGEPGPDMHVETLAHNKAREAMQHAKMFYPLLAILDDVIYEITKSSDRGRLKF